jgi:hypothetical protein
MTALLALLLYVPGCARWQVDSRPVPELLAKEHPSELRITRGDSSRVVLYQPALSGDSLSGTPARRRGPAPIPDSHAQPADGPRLTVALAEVRRIETKHTDTGRTLLLVLGVGAAVALATLIAIGISLQGGFLGS